MIKNLDEKTIIFLLILSTEMIKYVQFTNRFTPLHYFISLKKNFVKVPKCTFKVVSPKYTFPRVC